MAAEDRVELSHTESKSVALPLSYSAIIESMLDVHRWVTLSITR